MNRNLRSGKLTVLLIALVFAAISHAFCQAPDTISYQGKLTDNTGKAVTGQYDFIFDLYNDPTTGIPVPGSEVTVSTYVANGLYNIELGPFSGIPFDRPYWLGIQVRPQSGGGYQLLNPRVKLTSVPYAIYAATAAYIDNPDWVSLTTGEVIAPAKHTHESLGRAGYPITLNSTTTITGNLNVNGKLTGDGSGLTGVTIGSAITNLIVSANSTLGDANVDSTTVRGTIELRDSALAYPLKFGGDTLLYRNGANSLRTDGALSVGNNLTVDGVLNPSRSLTIGGNNYTVTIASALAVTSGFVANSTSTINGNLNVVGKLTGDGSGLTGITVGSAITNLVVSANSTLGDANVDSTTVRGTIELRDSALAYPLKFGSDTLLYRNGASSLRTDGALSVGNNLTVDGILNPSSSLTIGGNNYTVTIASALAVTSGFVANSTATVNGNLNVSGRFNGNGGGNLASLIVIGDSSLGSQPTNATTVRGTLTLQDSDIGHGLIIGDTRIYRGGTDNIRTNNTLTVGGLNTDSNLAVGGHGFSTTFSSQVFINSDLHVDNGGKIYVNGTELTSSGSGPIATLQVTGYSTLGQSAAASSTTIRGAVTLPDATDTTHALWFGVANLYGTGTNDTNDALWTRSSLNVGKDLYVLTGRATFGEAAEFLDTTTFISSSTFRDQSEFQGAAVFQGGMSVKGGAAGDAAVFNITNSTLMVTGVTTVNYGGAEVMANKLSQTGADLAEMYPSSEALEPGDVVCISATKAMNIERSKAAYDTKVAGVVSTAPGSLLGAKQAGYPLALAGRVPVKVIDEGGPIRNGDLLTTSSTPGYAMKASDPKIGTIIGKALESWESGKGKITVLITLQ